MLSEKRPYAAGETGALTQEEPPTAYRARGQRLTYPGAEDADAEDDSALEESGESPTLSLADPVSNTLSELLQSQSDPEEAARLRGLLAEKDRASLQFALADVDLRRRLAEAEEQNGQLLAQLLAVQSPEETDPATASVDTSLSPEAVATDIARMKADWRRAMQLLERENKERKAELVIVKAQLHQAQRQGEQEHLVRQMEAAKSSTSIASLETDLEEARGLATNTGRTQSGQNGRLRLAAVLATVAALTVSVWTIWIRASPPACSGLTAAGTLSAATPAWQAKDMGASDRNPAVAEATTQAPQVISLPGVSIANNSAIRPDPIEPGFGGGMSRLNGALAAHPNQRPEDILREIHRKAAGTDPSLCAFEWNNGQPSLLYGGANKLSLAVTVERCATAIEKYK